jgi:hypothetical protein
VPVDLQAIPRAPHGEMAKQAGYIRGGQEKASIPVPPFIANDSTMLHNSAQIEKSQAREKNNLPNGLIMSVVWHQHSAYRYWQALLF